MMNAIIYSPKGCQVSLVCDEIGDYVKIVVKDTGIGIPTNGFPRVFERFYRVIVSTLVKEEIQAVPV